MAKNYLAKKLKMAKNETFVLALDFYMKLMTIAINDVLKAGRGKLLQVENRFNELYQEYGSLVMRDAHYANAKLNERVNQIMREKRV